MQAVHQSTETYSFAALGATAAPYGRDQKILCLATDFFSLVSSHPGTSKF
jgi:hypothetical protein